MDFLDKKRTGPTFQTPTLGRMIVLLFVVCAFSHCSFQKKTTGTAGKKLVWADEFDKPGLPDPAKWGYAVGNGCPNICGWGNNELEFYTDRRAENARVENGKLIIEAHRENWQGNLYTSAKLVSKGKGDWTYGRMEARIKCPTGRGTWPAFWMLPSDWRYGGWPHSGEIDIMEHVGYLPDSVYGTVHTEAFNHGKNTQSSGGLLLEDVESDFHVYAIEWRADRIDFFVDEKKFHTFKNQRKTTDEWPFDQPFHLVMNLAVGGNWGGKHGVDEEIWPQRMEVDYVRVYSL